MNEANALDCLVLSRFFRQFRNFYYRGVPVAQFLYREIMSSWTPDWVKQNLPDWETALVGVDEAAIYSWSDAPYPCDPHPGGMILMRGGFGDIASLFLPKDRFFLICPSQAEVDLIKLNRPDLVAHAITNYYRDNPAAVELLNAQITALLNEPDAEPLLKTPEFLAWVCAKIPGLVRMLDAVLLLFETIPVGAVVTVSSTYSMDGALNLVAKANRIPSFTLQHGLMAEYDLFAHVPILATKKLVWGDAFLDFYRKFGFPESRVAVVGSPRFDLIFNRDWCGQDKLRQMLQIDATPKIVVYAADVLRIDQAIAPLVLEGLKTIPNLFLVLMQHPGENIEPHQEMVEGYANCKIIKFGRISLYDALSGADFFITCFSTAALEAMFFNLPVITVEPTPPTFSFGDLGASIKVSDAAGLHRTMSRLLAEPDFRAASIHRYQSFLARYCIPDGKAAQRLFDEVASLCPPK